ncbi:MAG: hypothetical protein V1811_03275 [Candidatus Micrarchaeota archaeon]
MSLDERVSALKTKRLDALSSEKKIRKKEQTVSKIDTEELISYKIRAAVYKKLLERYSEFVSLSEEKTIPELKSLVNPVDDSIEKTKQRLLEAVREEKRPVVKMIDGIQVSGIASEDWQYSFERDFPKFADKALACVRALHHVHADLSFAFWLSPQDVLEVGAADAFDRSIFLCSLLVSAGCVNARVRVVEVDGGERRPIVLFSFGNRFYAMDAAQEKAIFVAVDEASLLASFHSDGRKYSRSLYEFNNAEYNDFEE